MTSWTSVQPSLLTYFQALRICLFPLKAPRQRDRKSERQRTRQLRESEIWARAPATRCLHRKDSPHGPAIFIWSYTTTQHSYPALQTSVRPYLRHLPYTQFASRFGFTPLILSKKAGEEMVEGNSWEVEEVGKWVRGLRPKRRQLPLQHLSLPPESSTSLSPPLRGVEVTVGEGPLRGLQIGFGFTVPARSCM